MKAPSFRIQLLLISVLLSGVVLMVFGAVAWAVIVRERTRSLDQELVMSGQQILNRSRMNQDFRMSPPGMGEWLDGLPHPDQAAWVETLGGTLVRTSPNWPEAIGREDLFPGGMPEPSEEPEWPVGGLGSGDERPAFGGGFGGGGPGGMGAPGGVGGPGGPGRRLRGPMRNQPAGNRLGRQEPELFTLRGEAGVWRIGRFETPMVRLFVAVNQDRMMRDLDQIRTAFLVALPVALLLIAAGGLLIARQALGPVKALTHAAERITARGLDQRISEVSSAPEFRRLIQVFNDMLDRLEASFGQAIRFSADASHELKTPLAVMQGEIEQAIRAAEDRPEQQRVLSDLLEQVQRLKDITRRLLLLSQADAGRLPLSLQEADLGEMLEGLTEDIEVMAEAAGLSFRAQTPAGCIVRMDPNMLRMAVLNLYSNAVKYNESGGRVESDLMLTADWARLRITNTGPGIPEAMQALVFERFHRGNARQTGPSEGLGLGLGLAREIARAHGGDVHLASSRPGATVFELVLPRGDLR